MRGLALLRLLPVASALQNFGGGFKNPFANKNDGATFMKIQLAFRVGATDRGRSGVLGQLSALADKADTSTAEGVENLAQETALTLLRREREWVGCAGSLKHFGNEDDALRLFDKQCIVEAAKFDDVNPDRSTAPSGLPKDTVAVVSAIACCMGDREDAVGGQSTDALSGDARQVKAVLQELAAAASAEDEVFGFELLWCPDDDEETLDMDEVIVEWPEIMTI